MYIFQDFPVICFWLCNDPGKEGSNFFCYGTIHFPHIGTFLFSHRECNSLQKGSLRNKMYLNYIFKGCFFLFKDFDQSYDSIPVSLY